MSCSRQVVDMYLDLLQTFGNVRLPHTRRQRTSREFTDDGAADVFLRPQRMMSLIYNHYCFLTRFWKRLVRVVMCSVM